MRFSRRSILLLLASSLAHAVVAYDCFGADGTELKQAVNKYVQGTWETSTDAPNSATFGPIEEWCTKDVTNMNSLFWGLTSLTSFNANIAKWDVSSVTTMRDMFYLASAFNQNISAWDVSSVTNMNGMFNGAKAFNADISAWDVSSVTDMSGMFWRAINFNADISAWNTASVTKMNGMFYGASAFNQNLCAWKDRVPYGNARDLFMNSGCTYTSTPVETEGGPFCAVEACPAIASWDLKFASLAANFTKDSVSEITINYNIGKGRGHEVNVFMKGCKEAITPVNVVKSSSSTSSNDNDASLDNLQVLLDLNKAAIFGSNIWNGTSLVMCVMVTLLSGSNVIKTDERDISINLDFGNNFTAITDANLNQISLGNNDASSKVENYIEACTCDDANSFTCNTDSLSPDSFLNVCIRSLSDEMEIDYLENLVMTSNNSDEKLDIVEGADIVDQTITSTAKVVTKNGVHVASVIPSNFFSYSTTSTAKITGVVYLKLKGSRRHLAVDVEIAGRPKVLAAPVAGSTSTRALQTESVVDQKSAFAIDVELAKNELGGDANGATNAMMLMSGFIIVVANVIGAGAAAMMML